MKQRKKEHQQNESNCAQRNNFEQPPTNHSNIKRDITKQSTSSDTLIYKILQRERRGDNKCRIQTQENLKHVKKW
jgi:hypothetical protein